MSQEEPDGAAERPRDARGWRTWVTTSLFETFTVKQIVFGAFLVVLVLSIPLGGMRAVAKPKTEVVKADREVAVAPFSITLKGAWQTRDVGVPSASKIDGRYLMVGALISTKAKKSVPSDALKEAVRLVGVPGMTTASGKRVSAAHSTEASAEVMLVDADFHPMGDLPPGTTYGVYWIFTVKPGVAAPDELTVQLRRQTYRQSSLDQTLGYFDPEPVGIGRLPVEIWKVPTSTPAEPVS